MRRRAVVVTAGVTAALFATLLVGLVAGVLDDDAADGPTATQLEIYERDVIAAAQQGGQTVEMGLKVGIGDLGAEHRTAPAVLAEQAELWRADLEEAQHVFTETEPPPGLDAMQRDFVQALAAYVSAAELFREAALLEGPGRDALLDEAIEQGRRGDRLYDRAAAALQAARRKAGLQPSPDFPDR